MAPSRRKGSVKVSVSSAAAANRQWKIGDLVLAKVKGFPAWPATVSDPEEWGYSKDWKKVLVYFFGTKQIAFCSPADVEPFTEEKKQNLLLKRQGKGADFIRAVHEIIDSYEKSKAQELIDKVKPEQERPTNWRDGDQKILMNNHVYSSSETDTSQIRSSLSMKDADDPDLSAENCLETKKLSLSDDRRESRQESLPPNFLARKRLKATTPKSRGTLKRLSDVREPTPSAEAEIRYSNNSGLQSNEVFYATDAGFSIRRVKDNDSEIDAVESVTFTVQEYTDLAYVHVNGHRDSMMDELEDEVLCSNHDLMKEVVTKKRRKLNKRLVSDDETAVNLDRSGVFDCEDTKELSPLENTQPAAIQKDWNDDGQDLLLPPFKRALVRVQSTPLVEELNGDPRCAADRSVKSESSQFGKGSSSSYGGNSVSTDRDPWLKNGGNSVSSASHGHTLNHEDTPSHSEQNERSPCLDNEAVLPPSKRLRRALEAMSVNSQFAEIFEIDNGGSLSGKSFVTECSFVRSEQARRADNTHPAQVSNVSDVGPSLKSKEAVPSSAGFDGESRAVSKSSQIFDDNLTESASSIDVVVQHATSECCTNDDEELLSRHEDCFTGLACLQEVKINLSPPVVGNAKPPHEGSVSSLAPENSPFTAFLSKPGSDRRSLATTGGSLSPCHVPEENTATPTAMLLSDSLRNTRPVGKHDISLLRSFKAELGTLTRTKDSIGRATRMAMDCANHGIAREVVETLVLCMEKQAKMHRRVDLFFLVDSIIQSSSRLRGNAGNVYGCLIQEALPRLLSAAAPEGHAGHENRRQCLKVLRLWHERKVVPECALHHHLRELDGSSSCGSHSLRLPGNERAHNDPLRGMEDILVDEYGSNSRLELPGLLMATTTAEEESDSDDSTFEALTPEGNDAHRHILEDVEGELEMEDAIPSETVQDSSTAPPVPPSSSPPPPPPPPPPYGNFTDHSRHCAGKHVECDGLSRQSPSPRMFHRDHGKAYLTRLPSGHHQQHHHTARQQQHVQYTERNEANVNRPRFYTIQGADLYGRTTRPTLAYDARERWRFATSSSPFVVHMGQVPMVEAYKRGGRSRYQQGGVWSGMPPSSSRRVGRRNLVTFACPIIPSAVRAPISWRAR